MELSSGCVDGVQGRQAAQLTARRTGIHVARTRYIEHQRRTTSASSTSEVLAALPGQGEFTPPPAEPYSRASICALNHHVLTADSYLDSLADLRSPSPAA